jgi:hypothetical protein
LNEIKEIKLLKNNNIKKMYKGREGDGWECDVNKNWKAVTE